MCADCKFRWCSINVLGTFNLKTLVSFFYQSIDYEFAQCIKNTIKLVFEGLCTALKLMKSFEIFIKFDVYQLL